MKLISLNIEGHKHLERQLPFFGAERPDVLCLQEAFEPDVDMLSRELGMQSLFAPMVTKPYPTVESGSQTAFGVAMLSRLPFTSPVPLYYVGKRENVVPQTSHGWAMVQHVLLAPIFLSAAGRPLVIATTHFTWTPDGEPNGMQRQNLTKLFHALEQFPDLVLCGDFNAPRGGEIFGRLAVKYADAIPAEYQTSIDTKLHVRGASGELGDKMVDGLFSTPGIIITNVRLQSGVSDHLAIVADIDL